MEGHALLIDQLQAQFEAGNMQIPDDIEVGSVTGLIVRWLKMIPDRVIHQVYIEPLLAAKKDTAKLQAVAETMDTPCSATLSRLMQHMHVVSEKSRINKMTPKNLATCIFLVLVNASGQDMSQLLKLVEPVQSMIENHQEIFLIHQKDDLRISMEEMVACIASTGFMLAAKGTTHGESGWYYNEHGYKVHFEIDKHGNWQCTEIQEEDPETGEWRDVSAGRDTTVAAAKSRGDQLLRLCSAAGLGHFFDDDAGFEDAVQEFFHVIEDDDGLLDAEELVPRLHTLWDLFNATANPPTVESSLDVLKFFNSDGDADKMTYNEFRNLCIVLNLTAICAKREKDPQSAKAAKRVLTQLGWEDGFRGGKDGGSSGADWFNPDESRVEYERLEQIEYMDHLSDVIMWMRLLCSRAASN